MLFRHMWKRHAILFDAGMIRFSSIWLMKIPELSWSRAPLPASDWLASRIWLGVAFVCTVLRVEPPEAQP